MQDDPNDSSAKPKANKRATISGGLFFNVPSRFWQEWCGMIHLRASVSPPSGRPETLWSDLGGGMGTHRASGDVKAGTDRRTAVAEATAAEGIPEVFRFRSPWKGCLEGAETRDRTRPAYVPISHDARYFFCSFVSISIFIPMPASLRRAISLSITGGTG